MTFYLGISLAYVLRQIALHLTIMKNVGNFLFFTLPQKSPLSSLTIVDLADSKFLASDVKNYSNEKSIRAKLGIADHPMVAKI